MAAKNIKISVPNRRFKGIEEKARMKKQNNLLAFWDWENGRRMERLEKMVFLEVDGSISSAE